MASLPENSSLCWNPRQAEKELRMKATSALLGMCVLFAAPAIGAAAPKDEAAVRGEKVYSSVCWTCHGRYGRGDGPAAPEVALSLPDFTDSARWTNRSSAQVLERLRSG